MATGREIFKIFGTFTMDGVEKGEKDLKGLDSTAASTDKKMSGFGKTMGKVAKVAGTAILAVGAAGVALAKQSLDAANIQQNAEKRLETIARTVANASDEQIQAFKDQAAALQKVTTVGDEAIIQGQSQLQSFTKSTEAVRILTEDLTDLAVAQYGANVSGEQMQQTANMVGKALTGQLSALTRSGVLVSEEYTKAFEEANTEEERAIVVSQILAANYGGLARAAAETAEGGILQLKNQLGDLKERLGEKVQSVLVEKILPMASDLIDKLLPPAMALIDLVLSVLPQLLETIIPLLSSILPIITEVIQKLLPPLLSMMTTVLDAILPTVIQLIEILLPIIVQIFDAISPFLPVLFDLVSNLLPILMDIIMALVPIIEPIIGLITSLLDLIMPILVPAIQFLANLFGGVLKSAIEGITPIIDGLVKIFGGVIDFIKNIFAGNWEGVWDSVVKIFTGIWDTMKAIFKAPINWIIDGLNLFIGFLNKIKIPDWVPGIGGKGLNIKPIPKLAQGTDFFQGGMAIINDNPRTGEGGEIVDLPRGARVTPANESKGDTINIYANDTSPSGIIRAYKRNSKLTALGL